MSKSAKKRTRNQAQRCPSQQTLRLADFVRRNLMAFVVHEGLKALDVVLEQDREALCGPAHSKGAVGDPQRWGQTEGRLVLGGQRVMVRKPRVRQAGQEVELPSWAAFSDQDMLDERTFEQLILGVSTRDYARSLDPLPDEAGGHGTSRSAASRRFVETAQNHLDAWLNQDLSGLPIVVVMLDGIVIHGHTVLVALGIDVHGVKHPLGLWLGHTENAVVCGELLDHLIERGLDGQGAYLFVIDGSKALRKAIRTRFGDRALVQRCQQHKRTNVLAHLPKTLHKSVSAALLSAYRNASHKTAKAQLKTLIARLADDHPDAAASLSEGLNETLTVKALHLPTALERTLSTTNAIENLNGIIRKVSRKVKRWRNGAMVKRWTAAGILHAQRGFHRIKGHKGLPILAQALDAKAQKTMPIDQPNEAA